MALRSILCFAACTAEALVTARTPLQRGGSRRLSGVNAPTLLSAPLVVSESDRAASRVSRLECVATNVPEADECVDMDETEGECLDVSQLSAAAAASRKSTPHETVMSIRGGRNLTPSTVTILGAVVNVLLSLLKLVVGTLSGSASLVADAYHSGSDLLVDAVTMVAVHAPPTLERLFTLAIGGLLVATGGGLVWGGVHALWKRSLPSLEAMVGVPPLLVAVVAITAKELMYRVTHAVGLRTRQAVLMASAKHHRADAMSSLAAAIGAVGVLIGFPITDLIMSAVVGGMMVSMGASVARGAHEHEH